MRHLLTITVALTATLALAFGAAAGNGTPINANSASPTTIAVIGDTPYGPAQLEQLPELISAINSDPKVRLVAHLGDIKSGSTRCDDAYFTTIASSFATFKDPVVYTPGDNEWTDCHRTNNGSYDPLERLAVLRQTFFSAPGTSLGGRKQQVLAQTGYPENQLWLESKVVFAAVHVVGSNNGYAPWTGLRALTTAQKAEVDARIAAAVAWIEQAFATAARNGALGVVLLMQADTFFLSNETADGFDEIVARIGTEAASFGRPVLLLQGDTHDYTVDAPYATAPNLTRIVIEGETVGEWLRLTVDPRAAQLFAWERVAVGGGA